MNEGAVGGMDRPVDLISESLPNLSDMRSEIVCTAIEGNFAEVVQSWARLPGCEYVEREGTVLYVTGVPYPLFNGACLTDVAERVVQGLIQDVVAFFERRQLPMIWVVGPGTAPRSLGQHLISAGFEHSYDCVGMARDLRTLPEVNFLPGEVTVKAVESRRDLERWVKAYISFFDFPGAIEKRCGAMFEGLGLEGSWRRYGAFVEGEVVAVSSLLLGSEVAGLYDIATVESFRGQGIGKAMTLLPLLEASRVGYKIGILGSTSMGHAMYRQIGFTDYCALSFYAWNLRRPSMVP
jgi:hypothetical protein